MIFSQFKDLADLKKHTFKLSPSFVEGYKGGQPEWGYNGLGYFVYKRTYARDLPDGTKEEYWQTCKRVVEGVFSVQKFHCEALKLPWNDRKAQRSAQDMFTRMWEFKFLPPGRGLWMMGTDWVYEKGSAALNNCGFASTDNIDQDFSDPFCFLMDMSMLGVGVGGDTRGAGKVKLRVPKYTDVPYVVEDSREGWVELLKTVLEALVGNGSYPRNIDYSKVRGRGELINGFGGIASGPEPLMKMIEGITRMLIPADGVPYAIKSKHIVDIFNMVGACVVAGGVRRSSEIMFGEPEDMDFRVLKDRTELDHLYRVKTLLENELKMIQSGLENYWEGEEAQKNIDYLATGWVEQMTEVQKNIDNHPMNTHRWVSNNSIFAKVGMDYTDLAAQTTENGEPGYLWLDNVRAYGRMIDPPNWSDRRAMGANPCSEQSLEDRELCCLVETFPAHHDSLDDYQKTLKMAYLYAKTVTLIPTHDMRTNAVMGRNRRIGCSMSGIQQAIAKFGRRNFFNLCDVGYKYVVKLDETYSDWLCIRTSIKRTSVKPSGTVSLLPGAWPGMHWTHSEFHIRNVRVQNTSPYVKACRDAGYIVEADTYADDTSVISFPVHEKNYTKGKADVSIWQQVADAVDMQKYWADNQVSITVSFSQEEAHEIKACLEVFETQLKSISFLPLENHGYKQAPYIEITEEEYKELSTRLLPLDLSSAEHEVTEKFCDGDKCVLPIK